MPLLILSLKYAVWFHLAHVLNQVHFQRFSKRKNISIKKKTRREDYVRKVYMKKKFYPPPPPHRIATIPTLFMLIL